jgi:hypothetical protein
LSVDGSSCHTHYIRAETGGCRSTVGRVVRSTEGIRPFPPTKFGTASSNIGWTRMFNDALGPLSKKAFSSHMFVPRGSSETSFLTSLCRNDRLTLTRSVECACATRVDSHRNEATVYEISSTLSGLYWADYMQFGPNGPVFIAACYGLDGPRIESRWGWDFPHPSRPVVWPIQPPVQWVPGVLRCGKRLGRGVDHPPTSSDEIKERVELYLYTPSVTSWQVIQYTNNNNNNNNNK